MDLLPDRLAWYVAGPILGFVVVAMYALANRPVGATSSYAEALRFVLRRPAERWRIWFFAGLFAGAIAAVLLRGGPNLSFDYGDLGNELPLLVLLPLLVAAGLVMGFGARWSGGCTSGHGLRGCSALSPASLAATATFMAAAVAVTAVVHVATGGAL